MRNIFQYPITGPEIIEALNNAVNQRNQESAEACGSLDGLILHSIKELLGSDKELLDRVVQACNPKLD